MDQPELGKKIVQLRKGLNLTQEELARKSSLGLRTIQRIESGGVKPRNSTIDLLLNTLGVDLQSLKNYGTKSSSQNWFVRFLMLGDSNNDMFYSVIQTAWIAGIYYFLILIIENALEFIVFNENKLEMVWLLSYILLKLWVLVSFSLFIRGFIVLSKVFESALLRISSYVLIGLMIGIVFSDIIKVLLIENRNLILILTVSQSIVAGVTSLLFGVVLLRLQDSLGKLSKYAGITEVILGSCFILVFLSPVALTLMLPATVLEIVILYKGSEFIRSELLKET